MKLKKFKFKNVNSTNDIALRLIKKTKNKFGIVITNKQKKGRGQHGKRWISNNGNLFVSIFFSLEKINLSLRQMTKINCKLIKNLLSFYCKKKISIKPPNDLLIDKKKICGILQETLIKNNITYMVVGIGINLIKNPNISNYKTTNLFEITNNKIDKNKIIYKLKNIYEKFIPRFSKFKIKKINIT